jgi:hypothetical protein
MVIQYYHLFYADGQNDMGVRMTVEPNHSEVYEDVRMVSIRVTESKLICLRTQT